MRSWGSNAFGRPSRARSPCAARGAGFSRKSATRIARRAEDPDIRRGSHSQSTVAPHPLGGVAGLPEIVKTLGSLPKNDAFNVIRELARKVHGARLRRIGGLPGDGSVGSYLL